MALIHSRSINLHFDGLQLNTLITQWDNGYKPVYLWAQLSFVIMHETYQYSCSMPDSQASEQNRQQGTFLPCKYFLRSVSSLPHDSPCLWIQLHVSLCQPHSSISLSDSPLHMPVTSFSTLITHHCFNQSINQSINFIDERVKNHWHRHKNKHKLRYIIKQISCPLFKTHLLNTSIPQQFLFSHSMNSINYYTDHIICVNRSLFLD